MKHKCDGCRYKGEHRYDQFQPFGVCTKELNLRDAAAAYESDNCPYHRTIGDDIRAMSDEELAEFLNAGIVCDMCIYSASCTEPFDGKVCFDGVLKWLRQPAEDRA